jgi:hypothetical protein
MRQSLDGNLRLMRCRCKQHAPVVMGCAQDSSWCGWPQGLRKSAGCSLGRLRASLPELWRLLVPPEGVMGPLLRPSWQLQSAAQLWSAPLLTPAACTPGGWHEEGHFGGGKFPPEAVGCLGSGLTCH